MISNKKNIGGLNPISRTFSKEDFHEFISDVEADTWARPLYTNWANTYRKSIDLYNKLPADSMLRMDNPFEQYFGYKHREINDFLRKGQIAYPPENIGYRYTIAYTTLLTQAVFSAPRINRNIILYRQIPTEVLEEILKKMNTQGLYSENGFMSTSMVKSICAEECGHKGNMLKIYTAKETPAVYANVMAHRNEAELLLPPGINFKLIQTPYLDNETGKTMCEVEAYHYF